MANTNWWEDAKNYVGGLFGGGNDGGLPVKGRNYGETASPSGLPEPSEDFFSGDTNIGFKLDPFSDVPTTKEAGEGAARHAAAKAGVTTRQWNEYWRTGKIPGSSSRGGRGGGGRAAMTPQDIALLKDRFNDSVLGLTGMTPDQLGVSFAWYRPNWEGGWSSADFEKYYRQTAVFQSAYPGIDEEQNVDSYNAEARDFNDLSMAARGGQPATEEEFTTYLDTEEVPF